MGILKPIIVAFLSIAILAFLLPSVQYGDWTALIGASIVLTLLQKIVRPVLGVLLLPINIVTLGLFSWIINVAILWLLMILVPTFHVDQVSIMGMQLGGFMSLVFVSFGLGVIQSAIDFVF